MKTEFTDKPNSRDLDILADKINEENPDYPPATTFGFFIKEAAGAIIAGANGSLLVG